VIGEREMHEYVLSLIDVVLALSARDCPRERVIDQASDGFIPGARL
jgi:hypothetical protein